MYMNDNLHLSISLSTSMYPWIYVSMQLCIYPTIYRSIYLCGISWAVAGATTSWKDPVGHLWQLGLRLLHLSGAFLGAQGSLVIKHGSWKSQWTISLVSPVLSRIFLCFSPFFPRFPSVFPSVFVPGPHQEIPGGRGAAIAHGRRAALHREAHLAAGHQWEIHWRLRWLWWDNMGEKNQ